MHITIHKAHDTIGGNCVEVSSGGSRIVIDLGIPILNADGAQFDGKVVRGMSSSELLEKGIIPHVPGLYRNDGLARRPDAFFLSHAHVDHYGFMEHIHPDIPVYMGKGTENIIDISSIYDGLNMRNIKRQIRHFTNQAPITSGSITVTPFIMDHSAFDSYAFLIDVEGKKVLYTGDFREGGRKKRALDALLKKIESSVTALIIEGTCIGNVEESSVNIKSEDDLEKALISEIIASSGPVVFACSSQNIDRLVTFFRTAQKCSRLMVIDPYTAEILARLKDFGPNGNISGIPSPLTRKDDSPEEFAYENLRVFFSSEISGKFIKNLGKSELYKFRCRKINREEIEKNPGRIMMMVKESTEPNLRKFRNFENGLYIYSMWDGYRKKTDGSKLESFLQERNFEYRYRHFSGHASPETIKRVIERTDPEIVIPIHTLNPEKFTEFSKKPVYTGSPKPLEI